MSTLKMFIGTYHDLDNPYNMAVSNCPFDLMAIPDSRSLTSEIYIHLVNAGVL